MAADRIDEEIEFNNLPSLIDALLAPFRALVSKSALRVYLNTLLFIGVSLLLFGISGIAYGIFYLRFIPAIGLERVVHLQFGDGHPWGTASFDSEFVSSQPYDVAVTLELPRTPSNLGTGNFMIDLTLYSPPASSVLAGSTNTQNPISQSRRPAILTYASPLVDVARRIVRLPLYVVGWRREAETLEVQMMEKVEFARGSRNLPQSLRLEIQSDEKMQIYSAHVEFRARFTGMRWFMYRWKITSFLVFSSLFWTVSMASTSLTWLLLSSFRDKATDKIKGEGHDLVKHEPEDHSEEDTDDSEIKKEEPEDSTLVQSYPAEGDTGMGSAWESAEARGLQRRQSHAKDEQS